MQGLIEACLKTRYPDDFARIIEITYRFSYGWRRIHNPDSGEDVADDLTTTEFTMAMLACRGWTNAEIARHMGVSPGTVKNRLSGVYAKLGIGTRAELLPTCCASGQTARHIESVPGARRLRALAGTGDSNVPLTAAAAALAAAGAGLVAYSVRRTALEKDTANEVNSDRPR